MNAEAAMSELWQWIQTQGFLVQLGFAVCVLVGLVFSIVRPPAAAFLISALGLAYWGYSKWGIWGTIGGLVVGAFVGLIVGEVVDSMLTTFPEDPTTRREAVFDDD